MTHVRSLLLLLLGALLLLSQHTALTHAIWHQSHGAAHYTVATENPGASHDEEPGALCAFHAMLGQLLDGGSTAVSPCVVPAKVVLPAPSGVRHLLASNDIQPRSRGPPVLL